MSMTDIEFYSAFAEAYIAVLGSNAHWHVLAFVSFTFGCSGIRTGKKNWWGKLFPITFLLIAFLVATSVFLLAEEYISFLTESQHAQLLSKIVALKCSTILIGIISGGLLYDQLKSWIEPENT